MTKRELEALAVRALGEGAEVIVKPAVKADVNGRLTYAHAYESTFMAEVIIWARGEDNATRALAAALTALAEGK